MKSFRVNKTTSIICDWKNTRNGFKHEASLLVNGNEIDSTKICYLNRTWERYEYESVISKLLDKTGVLKGKRKQNFLDKLAGVDRKRVNKEFNAIAGIAMLGEIFGKDQKEKNDWKERMIRAGLEDKGLIMPDDWNTLSEDEKETRLDNVIKELGKND